jgi:NADH dehydrogenase
MCRRDKGASCLSQRPFVLTRSATPSSLTQYRRSGRDGKALVTFVDQSMSTRWSPFLYEVEGGAFSEGAGNAARAMPKTVHPFQLRLGRIGAIDRVKKEVTLAEVTDDRGRELIPPRRLDYAH